MYLRGYSGFYGPSAKFKTLLRKLADFIPCLMQYEPKHKVKNVLSWLKPLQMNALQTRSTVNHSNAEYFESMYIDTHHSCVNVWEMEKKKKTPVLLGF